MLPLRCVSVLLQLRTLPIRFPRGPTVRLILSLASPAGARGYSAPAWSSPGSTCPATSMRAYKRIVFTERTDRHAVYEFLAGLVASPQHAEAVEEFIFDVMDLDRLFRFSQLQAIPNNFPQQSSGPETSGFAQVLTDAGFDQDATMEYIDILSGSSQRTIQASKFIHYAAGLVILLCPNIHTLTFGDNSHNGPFVHLLQENNYSLLPNQYLQNLQHVTVLHTKDVTLGDDRFYTYTNVLHLLRLFHRLPALNSFSVDGIDDMREDLIAFPPATSNLKSLRIGHSSCSSEFLGKLIRIPRALERLNLTNGGRITLDGGGPIMSAMTISKALFEQRETIQEIDIDMDATFGKDDLDDPTEDEAYDDRDDWWHKDLEISTVPDKAQLRAWEGPATRQDGSPIGSMHDFASLTTLKIGVGMLLDGFLSPNRGTEQKESSRAPCRLVDALPPGLQSFTLRGYYKGKNQYYDWQVKEFMAYKAERFPRLQELEGIEAPVPSASDVYEEDDDSEEYETYNYKREVPDGKWVEAHA
ncbi:hypothetical protein B0I35DRAFT_447299 [Stachybotrys elegans]|uniref:Uncharacterized protein n=1 Tax=Stachybotrys elegans TaxID=80388 RepID=A0A8K0SAA3_9HYPO|nr:hypothetical protein B0I35DRAFT_447299 [Stachybotrys elegans]